ncbi:MAG: class I SAM-dependent methyltransferase [Chloroflexota bacterium]
MNSAYDDPEFFESYRGLTRSVGGPEAAMDWPHLEALLPDFAHKRVLDLGCGFGGLCRYASRQGARWVVGVDSSRRMLDEAVVRTAQGNIFYVLGSMSAPGLKDGAFDVVVSTLALHYVQYIEPLYRRIAALLRPGGDFVASFEHPVYTARAEQAWHTVDGQRLHWPVDNYQDEGPRQTNFMGGDVLKYHRTTETYVNALLDADFVLRRLVEPGPDEAMLAENAQWGEEARRPMLMMLAATRR